MKSPQLNILVIDDDPIYRNLLRSILKEKYNVLAVEAPSIAFRVLESEPINIVISDFHMPEMNGLQVLEKIKSEYPDIEVIMISSSEDMDIVIGALRNGAADYFRKPFTAAEIWLAIERTKKYAELNIDLNQEKKKNNLLKAEVNRGLSQQIIGKSEIISNIKEQIELVANTPDTSVLIIGESGTGKELVARGIHNFSSRKNEIFSAVNMSAIPESLFESEFFGHKKGSFTGAIADKAGWFEASNNGTLFLDEIGEMPLSMQVKLLRVLEDRKYTKVGAQREQQFDIRIVSATNKTIPELTESKDFRLDLFHRLGTFVIELPPLRDRKEDIPELAMFFLTDLSKKMNRNINKIHRSVFEIFNNYSFPGNIRELRNLIERAVIVCQDKELLPVHFSSLNTKITSNKASSKTYDLVELERRTIIEVLEKVDYNKAEAARLLNLEWNALYRRIQKFKIEFPESK